LKVERRAYQREKRKRRKRGDEREAQLIPKIIERRVE
jgi:hypothetical protein